MESQWSDSPSGEGAGFNRHDGKIMGMSNELLRKNKGSGHAPHQRRPFR